MRRPPLAAACRIAALALLAACGRDDRDAMSEAPPPEVTVASVTRRPVTPSVAFNGRVQAIDTVELRARVEGFIEKRLFEEGAEVRAGDLLIQLEKDPYLTQISQVKGQITAAEGTMRLAKVSAERAAALVKRDVAAKARLDQASAEYEQARGELQRLRAALEQSELELGYTDIHAPIDGRISRFAFSVGDLVGPSSEPLAVIVSQDPMYVTFPVSARELLEVRRQAAQAGRDPRAVEVRLRLPDGTLYDEVGMIDFVDVRVDPNTDTVTVRAKVPNPPEAGGARPLVSGQLVGVIVEQTEAQPALLIPQAAIAVDQAGPYVMVVGEGDEAVQRRIRPGTPQGTSVTVLEGLAEGERVIVDGLQRVRPGERVAPRPDAVTG